MYYAKPKRHITAVHKDQEEVEVIEDQTAAEQKKSFKKIINIGILQENQEECKLETPIFKTQKKCSGMIVHCGNCGGFYSRKFFYRHKSQCQGDQTAFPQPVTMNTLKLGFDLEKDEGFNALLSGIQNDEVGKLCKSDLTIKMIGARLYEKDRAKPDKEYGGEEKCKIFNAYAREAIPLFQGREKSFRRGQRYV